MSQVSGPEPRDTHVKHFVPVGRARASRYSREDPAGVHRQENTGLVPLSNVGGSKEKPCVVKDDVRSCPPIQPCRTSVIWREAKFVPLRHHKMVSGSALRCRPKFDCPAADPWDVTDWSFIVRTKDEVSCSEPANGGSHVAAAGGASPTDVVQ